MSAVSRTIFNQIGMGSLMPLGAHAFYYGEPDALQFKARILPYRKGQEYKVRAAAPRIMTVRVELSPLDTYNITVTYTRQGERVCHFEERNVYAEDLSRVMLALDYDGPQALNPRIVGAMWTT